MTMSASKALIVAGLIMAVIATLGAFGIVAGLPAWLLPVAVSVMGLGLLV